MNKNRMRGLAIVATAWVLASLQGCSTQAPSIAHVHIGHAITGINGTPDDEGYFVVAERYADTALSLANAARNPSQSQNAVKEDLDALNKLINTREELPFVEALREAGRHIEFAADMDDASANVARAGPKFVNDVESILYRCNLIKLYTDDAILASDEAELRALAEEIYKLTRANVMGVDLDADGTIGNVANEYGMRQLREDLDAMIADENPPYRTVDRWYLFNLIRLPSGDWIFNRGQSGSARGY